MGRHDREHLPLFLGILEKQLDIETKVEAALVYDGYDPRRILANMPEIRGVLFNHPTRGMALSERTLDRYLREINESGTRHSTPYLRIVGEIHRENLSL
jgi:hypothetical protein